MSPRLATAWHQARTHLVVFTGLGVLRLAWHPPMSVCLGMTTAGCLGVAGLVVVLVGTATVTGRACWLGARTHAALRALHTAPVSPDLATAATRGAAPGIVRCVATAEATAFCAGLLRPRIYVTTGLLAQLHDTELDAVLAHEADHARAHDPLRRILHRAVADIGAVVPILRWWAHRRMEHSELRADRAAVTAVGTRPVAAALLTLDPGSAALGTAFGGAPDARVAQLLGDPPARRPPSLPTCLVSLASLVLLVSLAMCIGQALLTLH